MSKGRYNALKAMGKCVVCGVNPADDGFTTCLVCRIERRNIKENRGTESTYHHRQWLKRLRDLNYAFGVCIVCGKRDAEKGSSLCGVCKAKARARQQDKRRKNDVMPRILFGDGEHCSVCGGQVESSRKMCDKCYPKYREMMLYARSCRTSENYFEKQNKAYWREKNADRRN